MYSNNSNGSRTVPARGFMGLFAMLAMGLSLMARPAAASPFAYVTKCNCDGFDNVVSVIDTATNKVVATVRVGNRPNGVAVTPDGKQVYVANFGNGTVSVIDTITKPPSVVATVTVGGAPSGSPSRRMGNTPMSRKRSPAMSR